MTLFLTAYIVLNYLTRLCERYHLGLHTYLENRDYYTYMYNQAREISLKYVLIDRMLI